MRRTTGLGFVAEKKDRAYRVAPRVARTKGPEQGPAAARWEERRASQLRSAARSFLQFATDLVTARAGIISVRSIAPPVPSVT